MKAKPMQVHVRVHESEDSSSRRVFDVFVIVFFLLIVGPSLLLFAAKDSLPTNTVYPAKLFFERVVSSLVSFNLSWRVEFSFILLDQRFVEADKLLSNLNSTGGFQALIYQARETEQILLSLPSGSWRYQIISRFKDTIRRYESSFEGRKLELVAKHGGKIESVTSLVLAIDQEKMKLAEIRKDAEEKRSQKN